MMKPAGCLASFIERSSASSGPGRACVVLTGAGCSTESGIPDYRGPNGQYRRADFVPMTFQNFMRNDDEKRRYWARSMLGYSTMATASCNAAHMALQALTNSGVVSHIFTQNVDGLHHLATYGGVSDVEEEHYYKCTSSDAPLVEVHGNIHRVICMSCGFVMPRARLQRKLKEENPTLYEEYGANLSRLRPDGDYSVPMEAVNSMRLIMCPRCSGFFKPHVVLFGENVPKPVVVTTMNLVRDTASCLLCLGTSLQVYSAYRYVLEAKQSRIPVAVVNDGATRADNIADLKLVVKSVGGVLAETAHEILGVPVAMLCPSQDKLDLNAP
ncbi:hypothetical protein JKF63_04900 [Porcisia hertigi]|uniref:NAD-dependent protein deacylase n=1 Tax=Porcisia hertigi TaxID=2761500 RepID=A0A836IVF8_9TRYP|nr:hypothetical protein JKF63_04900 [Porcisia hertigi]